MQGRSFSKNYWEVYPMIILVLLAAFVYFVIAFNNAWVNVAISQIMISLILAGRLVSKKYSQFSDFTWLFIGAVIISASINFFLLTPEGNDPSVRAIQQFLTLVWAPIGAGLVVGPIMKTSVTNPSGSPTVPAQVSGVPMLRVSIEIDGQPLDLALHQVVLTAGLPSTPSTPDVVASPNCSQQ